MFHGCAHQRGGIRETAGPKFVVDEAASFSI